MKCHFDEIAHSPNNMMLLPMLTDFAFLMLIFGIFAWHWRCPCTLPLAGGPHVTGTISTRQAGSHPLLKGLSSPAFPRHTALRDHRGQVKVYPEGEEKRPYGDSGPAGCTPYYLWGQSTPADVGHAVRPYGPVALHWQHPLSGKPSAWGLTDFHAHRSPSHAGAVRFVVSHWGDGSMKIHTAVARVLRPGRTGVHKF